MKVHVYDTHIRTSKGNYYHFDVLVSDETMHQAIEFAQKYIKKLGLSEAEIKQNNCDFCHSEMANPDVQNEILKNGYYIIPMQGCPKV
jgi:hypothetical protein